MLPNVSVRVEKAKLIVGLGMEIIYVSLVSPDGSTYSQFKSEVVSGTGEDTMFRCMGIMGYERIDAKAGTKEHMKCTWETDAKGRMTYEPVAEKDLEVNHDVA